MVRLLRANFFQIVENKVVLGVHDHFRGIGSR